MLKVITKEIPIDEELKTRIQFICDFCNTTPTFINGSIRKVEKTNINYIEPNKIISEMGLMAKAFPISSYKDIKTGNFEFTNVSDVDIDIMLCVGTAESDDDLLSMTQNFKFGFMNAGYMMDGQITTMKVIPVEMKPTPLNKIVQSVVDESYYIRQDDMGTWTYMKGTKRIPRTSKDGHSYVFSEGPIAFPDPLDRPGRTMLTSESTKNRSTHVVADPASGRLRLLTEIEAERLQGFDDDWTKNCLVENEVVEMPKRMRYFCMGNALVVPMITRMGRVLDDILANE